MHPPSCGRRARARRAGLVRFRFRVRMNAHILVSGSGAAFCVYLFPSQPCSMLRVRSFVWYLTCLFVYHNARHDVRTPAHVLLATRSVCAALVFFLGGSLFTWLGTAHAPALSRYTYAYAHPYFLTRTTTIRLSQSLVFFPSFLSSFTFSAHKWSAGRINSDIVGIVQYSCYTTWITLVAIIPPCSRVPCEQQAGRATGDGGESSN